MVTAAGRRPSFYFPPRGTCATDAIRLVSTVNSVPSPDDIDRILRHGVPGTSMRAFSELDDEERGRVVREILRIRQEGATK